MRTRLTAWFCPSFYWGQLGKGKLDVCLYRGYCRNGTFWLKPCACFLNVFFFFLSLLCVSLQRFERNFHIHAISDLSYMSCCWYLVRWVIPVWTKSENSFPENEFWPWKQASVHPVVPISITEKQTFLLDVLTPAQSAEELKFKAKHCVHLSLLMFSESSSFS